MRINDRDLRHLPVITQSGINLGKVINFDIDVETHAVVTYLIRGGLRDFLTGKTLLITPADVVAITAEKIIVKDGAVPVELRSESMRAPVAETPTSMNTLES